MMRKYLEVSPEICYLEKRCCEGFSQVIPTSWESQVIPTSWESEMQVVRVANNIKQIITSTDLCGCKERGWITPVHTNGWQNQKMIFQMYATLICILDPILNGSVLVPIFNAPSQTQLQAPRADRSPYPRPDCRTHLASLGEHKKLNFE